VEEKIERERRKKWNGDKDGSQIKEMRMGCCRELLLPAEGTRENLCSRRWR
jgi:hypothetical protein